MTPKSRRLIFILLTLGCVCGAAILLLLAFRDHITFFYAPSDVLPLKKHIRLGGMVKTIQEKGISTPGNETQVLFVITDYNKEITVSYRGTLPDLFREGQGAVMEGKWQGDFFEATRVLAKHDENYMPPEVADSLKKKGLWREPSRGTK